MEEKKRKRLSDKSGRPPKKVAIDHGLTTVKFSVVRDEDELCPVIASTPGLLFPNNVPLNPYKKRLKDTRILPPGMKVTSPYELLVHSSEHPKVDYTGREEHDGNAESFLKHYIGVYDPKAGDVKIIEARKLVVRSTLRREVQEMQDEIENAAEVEIATRYAQRNELGITFGTKKAKKAITSLTENAISSKQPGASTEPGSISSNPIAAAVLDSMTGVTSTMPAREETDAAVDAAKPRPLANLDATTPAEVYTAESLVGRETLALLNVQEWQDAAKAKKAINTHSRFVANRLQLLGERNEVKKLKVLRYILLMLTFHGALKPMRGGGRKLPPKDELLKKLGVAPALFDGLKRKFVMGGEMSKWHVDNLMTHIAACALIVDNCEVDTYDLREDLRLESKQIAQYFQEIGCRVGPPTETERNKFRITSKADAVNHKIAKLKIPLSFPKQRVGAKKR